MSDGKPGGGAECGGDNSRAPGSMGDRTPLVSVIVPCYNKPEYLAECLKSVQDQTFTDWECIVVSDGSPRVEEIRAAVAAMKDDRFRVVEHVENKGPCAARNTGARAARGEYLAFLDSDDCLRHDFLKVMVAEIKRLGAGHFCACYLQRFGDESRLRAYKVSSVREIAECAALPPAGSLFMKRGDYLRSGGFLEDPILRLGMEDTEFWIRLTWREKLTPNIVEAPMYFWRATESSLSGNLAAHDHAVRRRIVDLHPELFREDGIRARFLAKGYRKSSYAQLQMGRRTKALLLRLRVLYYESRLSGWKLGVRHFLSFTWGLIRREGA